MKSLMLLNHKGLGCQAAPALLYVVLAHVYLTGQHCIPMHAMQWQQWVHTRVHIPSCRCLIEISGTTQ